MAAQLVVTGIFAFYLIKFTDVELTILVPFTNGYELNLGWLAVPLMFFAIIGTVNGVNFTDGVDGLSSTLVLVGLITLGSIFYFILGHTDIAEYLLVPHCNVSFCL